MVAVTSVAVVRILRFIEAPFCSIAAMRRARNERYKVTNAMSSLADPKRKGGDCFGHALHKDAVLAPRGGAVPTSSLSKSYGQVTRN
jgi:hypothetical protein